MTLIDDIKRDQLEGTPKEWGDWVATGAPDLSTFVCLDNDDHAIIAAISTPGSADAKRIARVPAMEEAILAAVELADRVGQQQDGVPMRPDYVSKALTAFRKALEAGQ